MAADDVGVWQRVLRAVIRRTRGVIDEVVVLEEVESTQDAAAGRGPGVAVVALRQRAGRGRMGSAWEDTRQDGMALTIVTAPCAPERLAIGTAVAVAVGVERHVSAPVGIKWPNDIVARGRKLAGILIEQDASAARVGIGVNVAQHRWPAPLADRAVSLAQLGAACTRLEVAASVLEAFAEADAAPETTLVEAFTQRDALVGTTATFLNGPQRVTGRVLAIDPMRGLAVEVAGGRAWLPAATTRVCPPIK